MGGNSVIAHSLLNKIQNVLKIVGKALSLQQLNT